MADPYPADAGADLLLVDNDATIAELVAWVLQRAGHRVRTAHSFVAARALLAAARPDLVLSDVDLGAESALVELPRLAAQGLLPATLVVSGYLDEDKRALLGRLPMVVGFLDKPFDPRELAARVGGALELAAARGLVGRGAPGAAAGALGVSEPPPSGIPDGDGSADEDDGWVEIGGAP